MATGLRHGNTCRTDEPESSKDLSSPLRADHDVPQTPSSSLPGKQGLSHGARDSPATKQRRLSLAAIFSWKKLKVSPVLTTVTSDEVGIVKALQRLDLHSQWSNLPDHLLESILILMKDGDKDDWGHVQALFQVCAVCPSWREIGKRVFFSQPWKSATLLCHPLQLFTTKPTPLITSSTGNLLRCFVRRDPGGDRAVAKFSLFLGQEHNQPEACKFLMAALLNSRWQTMLYLTANCASPPAAKLQSNVFGTHYELILDPSMVPFEGANATDAMGRLFGKCESLMDVQYKTRLKGFMRPRRMRVGLPRSSVPERFSSKEGLAADRKEAASLREGDPDSFLTGARVPKIRLQSDAPSSSHGDSVSDRAASSSSTSLSQAPQNPTTPCRSPYEDVGGLHGVELRNKPPHWNESLRCWCLNFRGRVKLASVKNFQLIVSTDPTKTIVMQFGKVDANTYIMDFNPQIVSAAQAFAVSLSTFDTKVLL